MSTTLKELELELNQLIADDMRVTATSDGAADGTTVISTALKDKPDGYFNDWWLMITSGDANEEIQKVSDFVQSTGTLPVYTAFSTKILKNVTFELHLYDPAVKKEALNFAALECFPDLFEPLDDTTLTANNHLPDGSFERWASSSALDYWDVVGSSATVAKESTEKLFGSFSAKLTRSGTNCYLGLGEYNWPRLLDLENAGLDLYCWVKCSDANTARIAVYDGTTLTYSDYHSGGGEWELLEVDGYSVQDDATTVEVRLYVESNDVSVYFDNCRLIGPTLYEYLLPDDFVVGPTQVLLQTHGNADDIGLMGPPLTLHDWQVIDDGTHRWLRFGHALPSNKKIILRGVKAFTEMSGWTDSISIDKPKTSMICAYAAMWLFRSLVSKVSAQDASRFEKLYGYWRNEYELLRRKYAKEIPQPVLKIGYLA